MKPCLLLICILIVASCGERCPEKSECSSVSSIEEIPWISTLTNAMTNCSCEISIIRGTYAHQTVFFIALTDPLCNGINTPQLYNCEGVVIRSFTSSPKDQEDLMNQVTRDDVLYRCKS